MTSDRPASSRARARRHDAIRRLVTTGGVRTQDDLVAGLARLGMRVTQATVSRDVEELGLVRVRLPNRGMIYAWPESSLAGGWATEDIVARRRLSRLLAEVPVDVVEAAAFLLVRTAPGTANLLAAALDASAYPAVAGTVAGDDTILIAVRQLSDVESVRALFQTISPAFENDDDADEHE